MPIRKPDIRELKTKVELKVIYNQNRGDANGDYAIFDIAPDAQNLRPGNYDTINNNPNITFGTLSLLRRSTRVKTATSVQNGKMLEVNANPSASSCTFAYGAIGNDQAYPRNEAGARQANTDTDRLNYDVMLQNGIVPNGYRLNHHTFANLLKGPTKLDGYDYYALGSSFTEPNPPLWGFTYDKAAGFDRSVVTGFTPQAAWFYEINNSFVPRVDGDIYRNNKQPYGAAPSKALEGGFSQDFWEKVLFNLLAFNPKILQSLQHNKLRKVTTYNIWNVYVLDNTNKEVPANTIRAKSANTRIDGYNPNTTNYSAGRYQENSVVPPASFIGVRLGLGPYIYSAKNDIITEPNSTNTNTGFTTTVTSTDFPRVKLYSIYDNNEGVLLFVDSIGTGTETLIKRVFPVNRDAIYDQNAPYLFPTLIPANISSTELEKPWSEAVYANPAETGNAYFAYDEIKSTGGDNCGFHIRLSSITMNSSDSRIKIELVD